MWFGQTALSSAGTGAVYTCTTLELCFARLLRSSQRCSLFCWCPGSVLVSVAAQGFFVTTGRSVSHFMPSCVEHLVCPCVLRFMLSGAVRCSHLCASMLRGGLQTNQRWPMLRHVIANPVVRLIISLHWALLRNARVCVSRTLMCTTSNSPETNPNATCVMTVRPSAGSACVLCSLAPVCWLTQLMTNQCRHAACWCVARWWLQLCVCVHTCVFGWCKSHMVGPGAVCVT